MAPSREWFEKDYYAVLGVPETASQKDVTKAYRKLARETHPDANPGSEEKFKEVSAAYDVVGDPERRKEYDQVRAMGGPMGSRMSGGGAGGFGRPGDASFNGADLGDLISNLFGRGEQPQWSPGGPFSRGPQRGTDLEA